jgi:hypothetical protein
MPWKECSVVDERLRFVAHSTAPILNHPLRFVRPPQKTPRPALIDSTWEVAREDLQR